MITIINDKIYIHFPSVWKVISHLTTLPKQTFFEVAKGAEINKQTYIPIDSPIFKLMPNPSEYYTQSEYEKTVEEIKAWATSK